MPMQNYILPISNAELKKKKKKKLLQMVCFAYSYIANALLHADCLITIGIDSHQ